MLNKRAVATLVLTVSTLAGVFLGADLLPAQ